MAKILEFILKTMGNCVCFGLFFFLGGVDDSSPSIQNSLQG